MQEAPDHRASYIIKSYAAQFHGDPLLMSKEQNRLRSLVKDQKDKMTVRGTGGGGKTPRRPGRQRSPGGKPGRRGGKTPLQCPESVYLVFLN